VDRDEALTRADELVTVWMEQVKNQRGYVADGWKPADPTLRTDAVLRIADWLVKPLRPPVAPLVAFCNWCDDPEHPSPVHHPGMQVEHIIPEPECSCPGPPVFTDGCRVHDPRYAGR